MKKEAKGKKSACSGLKSKMNKHEKKETKLIGKLSKMHKFKRVK